MKKTKKTIKKRYAKMNREEYLSHRNHLIDIRTDSFDDLDKRILSLSTGALALSIVFVEKFGKPSDKTDYYYIILCWISFASALVLNLMSFVFAILNSNLKIKELDTHYTIQEKTGKSVGDQKEKNFWTKITVTLCNSFSIIFFLLGILWLLIFSIKVQYESIYPVEEKDNQKEIKMTENKSFDNNNTTTHQVNDGKTEMSRPVAEKNPKSNEKK